MNRSYAPGSGSSPLSTVDLLFSNRLLDNQEALFRQQRWPDKQPPGGYMKNLKIKLVIVLVLLVFAVVPVLANIKPLENRINAPVG